MTKKILKEITLCICLLAQFMNYKSKDSDNVIGHIELFIDSSNYLSLCTTENYFNSPMVCFFKSYKYMIINPPEYNCMFNEAVETKREKGTLKLYYLEKVILEVEK